MLSRIGFFAELSEADRETVRERCSRVQAKPKQVLVEQGGLDRDMYVVERGRLRISTISEEGKEIGIGVLEPGDTFGEMAMLDNEPRSATITTMDFCELLKLSPEDFKTMVLEQPSLAFNLLGILAQRLRHTTKVYQDTVFRDIPARLAQFLLEFSHPSMHSEDEQVLDFSLSQYELGTLINASRESVNKQLREWEEQGVIRKNRGRIRLLDLDVLRTEADQMI